MDRDFVTAGEEYEDWASTGVVTGLEEPSSGDSATEHSSAVPLCEVVLFLEELQGEEVLSCDEEELAGWDSGLIPSGCESATVASAVLSSVARAAGVVAFGFTVLRVEVLRERALSRSMRLRMRTVTMRMYWSSGTTPSYTYSRRARAAAARSSRESSESASYHSR